MELHLASNGVSLAAVDGAITFGGALPTATITVGDRRHDWRATLLTPLGDAMAAEIGTTGVRVELRVDADARVPQLSARLVNASSDTATLGRLSLVRTGTLRVGDAPARWRAYRNGYQSWAGTWTIGVDERDRDVPTAFGRAGVTDRKHPSPTARGRVRSDAVGAVVEPVSGHALAAGFLTLGDAFGFVELTAPRGRGRRLECWVDLDDTPLEPHTATPWFTVAFAAATDAAPDGTRTPRGAGTRALSEVIAAAGDAMGALVDPEVAGADAHHPSGWCSWYYYFTKVTEADIDTNLEVLAADGVRGPRYGCEYVMVDDGHQTAIGDWLSTNDKFPSGMAAVAGRIRDAGFDAGIWWAPFIVSSKSVAAEQHPDWLVRDAGGKPVLGLINPGWGITTPMWVLDTTHPDVLAHIRNVARTISRDWGYRIQKIDFLYAAALEGVRHDAGATRARALRSGLQAVRDGAGHDTFVLGCGCPLGPAVGLVDAMRIGADVTPSWTTLIGRTAGRGRHALATVHALLNTLTRSPFDQRWFLNDPDCLMVRDTDTELTEAEVHLMCTVFGMTNGMVVLSDRMDRLPPGRQELVATTQSLAGGEPEVVDLFERAMPRLLVSRHADRTDVAVLNLEDRPYRARADLVALGLSRSTDGRDLRDLWTGAPVTVRDGRLDLGELPPHTARVVQIPR